MDSFLFYLQTVIGLLRLRIDRLRRWRRLGIGDLGIFKRLVLDPDNPDVYWGLAESERHLGRFADARENYQKIMEYDPGSHHAKEASKALKDPEIANAKAAPALQPATAQPQ